MFRSQKEAIEHVQRTMADRGFYPGPIDGIWGNQTDGGFDAFTAAASTCLSDPAKIPYPAHVPGRGMAWGAKVSALFRDRVVWISDEIKLPADVGPNALMACMAFESGRTFSPSIRNAAGSGATGLIQFMPSTALPYFHTDAEIRQMSVAEKAAKGRAACDKLAAMSAEEQLNYVFRYFKPYTGRLKNLGDVYMAILWPGGVGKADDFPLWDSATKPTTYRQNAGLDVNRNGVITRGEALTKIRAMLDEGMKPGNYWAG